MPGLSRVVLLGWALVVVVGVLCSSFAVSGHIHVAHHATAKSKSGDRTDSEDSSSSRSGSKEAMAEAKIEAKLLAAVHADVTVTADIMVELESPQRILERECNTSNQVDRTQKTSCMVNDLEKFAEEAQKPVHTLLNAHRSDYDDATFFWINNSVSVKKAKGSLILQLAALDVVLKVRPEQIFHTMNSGEANEQPKPKASFGIMGM